MSSTYSRPIPTGPLMTVTSPKIGQKYHLSWARSHGYVWKLIAIEGDLAILETPKTKKVIRSKLDTLRHTRKNEMKLDGVKYQPD